MGDFSLRVKTDTGLNDYVELTHYLPGVTKGKIGLEVWVSDNTTNNEKEFYLCIEDGEKYHCSAVKLNTEEDRMYYYDEDQNWVLFATNVEIYATPFYFSAIKFVIDMDQEEYVRCIFDKEEYDLSGNSYYTSSSTETPKVLLDFVFRNLVEGQSPETDIDSVILTQNEP